MSAILLLYAVLVRVPQCNEITGLFASRAVQNDEPLTWLRGSLGA